MLKFYKSTVIIIGCLLTFGTSTLSYCLFGLGYGLATGVFLTLSSIGFYLSDETLSASDSEQKKQEYLN